MRAKSMRAKSTRLLLIAILALLIVFISCSSKGSSRNVSQELKDKLSNSMNFDSGQILEDTKPSAKLTEDYAKISDKVAPDLVRIGEDFSVTLKTNFIDTTKIVGVLVWIDGSQYYIRINERFTKLAASLKASDRDLSGDNLESSLTLSGTIDYDMELTGYIYTISLALLMDDGHTGEVIEWDLEIPSEIERDEFGENPFGNQEIWTFCNENGMTCSESDYTTLAEQMQLISLCDSTCRNTFGIPTELSPSTDNIDQYGWNEYYDCLTCCNAATFKAIDRTKYINCLTCISTYNNDSYDDIEDVRTATGEDYDLLTNPEIDCEVD